MDDPRVIAVGSINVDFQVLAERRPKTGETLLAQKFLMHGGGKAANVAYLARRFGIDSAVVGRVGSDLLSDEALKPLIAAGVDISLTKAVKGQRTGVALIIVGPDANKVIYLASNANDAWQPSDGDEVALVISQAPTGSILVIDLEIPINIVRRSITAARDAGQRIILDPSPAGRMPSDIYASIDFVIPNMSEAEQLTGTRVRSVEEAFQAGRILVGRGVGMALIKMGARGCALVNQMTEQRIPAPKVHAVDTTGGGDAFAGALAVALIEENTGPDAVRFAVTTAALAVTKFGSQPAYPARHEVEEIIAKIPKAALYRK